MRFWKRGDAPEPEPLTTAELVAKIEALTGAPVTMKRNGGDEFIPYRAVSGGNEYAGQSVDGALKLLLYWTREGLEAEERLAEVDTNIEEFNTRTRRGL